MDIKTEELQTRFATWRKHQSHPFDLDVQWLRWDQSWKDMWRAADAHNIMMLMPWLHYESWRGHYKSKLHGFEERFKPGKSPFEVIYAVSFDFFDSQNVGEKSWSARADGGYHVVVFLVSNIPSRLEKWEETLRRVFEADSIELFTDTKEFLKQVIGNSEELDQWRKFPQLQRETKLLESGDEKSDSYANIQ